MARSSSEEWAKRVARWKASGLTAKEFAAKTGVNPSTLAYWRWRLSSAERVGGRHEGQPAGTTASITGRSRKGRAARDRKPPTPASAEFVELPVAAVTTTPSALELLVGEHVRVRVPADFDEATLTRVVKVLGAAR